MNCIWEQLPNGTWRCSRCGWLYNRATERPPRRNCPKSPAYPSSRGVGSCLHDLLREQIGVDYHTKCNCQQHVLLMNEWGVEECQKNLDKIVGWLLSEARKRKWQLNGRPLLSAVARVGCLTPLGMIVARTWARAIVREAITRSKQSEQEDSTLGVRSDDRTK